MSIGLLVKQQKSGNMQRSLDNSKDRKAPTEPNRYLAISKSSYDLTVAALKKFVFETLGKIDTQTADDIRIFVSKLMNYKINLLLNGRFHLSLSISSVRYTGNVFFEKVLFELMDDSGLTLNLDFYQNGKIVYGLRKYFYPLDETFYYNEVGQLDSKELQEILKKWFNTCFLELAYHDSYTYRNYLEKYEEIS